MPLPAIRPNLGGGASEKGIQMLEQIKETLRDIEIIYSYSDQTEIINDNLHL